MKIATLLFGLLLLFAAQTAFAIVDGPTPRQPSFVPNEVIVKYKNGQSPEELRALVGKRASERQALFGFFRLLFEDFRMQLQKQETPEGKLKRLEEADKKVGVVSKERVFRDVSDPTLTNTYLLKLKQGSDVLKVVELYKGVPEVEYAEPNYRVRIAR